MSASIDYLKTIIKPYVRHGNWECDYDLHRVLPFLVDQAKYYPADYDPPFQRGHVWTTAQQEAWITHFFRAGESGRRIFFNMPGWQGDGSGVLLLIDGKQRLEAIRAFMNNEIKAFGKTYAELTPNKAAHRYLMSRNHIRINVNTLKTRAEVLTWYLQMNDGGTPHTFSELRKVKDMLRKEIRA